MYLPSEVLSSMFIKQQGLLYARDAVYDTATGIPNFKAIVTFDNGLSAGWKAVGAAFYILFAIVAAGIVYVIWAFLRPARRDEDQDRRARGSPA